MSRRKFFDSLRNRALDAATASVAALPLAPAAGSALILLGIGAQDSVVNALPPGGIDQLNQTNLDLTIPLDRGGSIRILGLHHTTSCYERAKGELEPKIASADIVLYELGQWFDTTIGDPARARGQKVATVEGTFTQGKGALALIGSVAYVAIKSCDQVKSGFHYATRALLGKSSETLPRRTVVANTAKMSAAVCVGTPVIPIAAEVSENKSLLAWDISPLTDGRTVKMLDNAFACAEKHPGKNIAVVVGNGHAKGMKFYLEDPVNMRIFSAKRALYKAAHLNAVDFRLKDKSTPGVL
jgi:hypothetical protein